MTFQHVIDNENHFLDDDKNKLFHYICSYKTKKAKQVFYCFYPKLIRKNNKRDFNNDETRLKTKHQLISELNYNRI